MEIIECITQLATIFSPIIAVGIAVWANWQNNKSVKKQLDHVKIMLRQQINVQLMMLDIEFEKILLDEKETKDEIVLLSKEISILSQSTDPIKKEEIDKLRTKISQLEMTGKYKGNRKMQIAITQFNLLQQSEKIKTYN